MRDNQILLSDIKQFLLKDNIDKDNNIISLGDLYTIINSELFELRKKYIDFNLNKELKKTPIINLNHGLNSVIIVPRLIYWGVNSNTSSIIRFKYNYNSYVEFIKNMNQDDLKFDYYYNIKEKEFLKFIRHHYNNIQKLFCLLGDYYCLIGDSSYTECYREKISSELFDITLKIDNTCLFNCDNILKFKIRINPDYQNSSSLYCSDMIDENRIYNIINKNAFGILNRIPVDVTKLSDEFRTIYENYVNRQKNNDTQFVKKKGIF